MSILRLIKKGDIIIIAVLIILSIVGIFMFPGEEGDTVTVMHDGKTVYTGSLDVNREIRVSDDYENIIVIKDGQAYFEHSDCPNLDCVRSGKINKSSQTAACLPNKTVIKITGESEVDDIAK